MKKITIKDVAKLAGVSVSTVSFVFNNPDRVNVDTKRHVLDIANKLGYIPNFNAAALRGKSMTIALIANFHPDQSYQNPTVMEGLPYLAQQLTQLGFYFMPFFIPPNDQRNEQLLSLINNHRLAGVIFLASRQDLSILDTALQQKIPTVVIGTLDRYDKVCSVDNDNINDSYTATMLAYQKGYKRVAFLSGDLDYIVCKQRLNGYIKAVEEKNFHLPIIQGYCEDRQDIEQAVATIVEKYKATAIVVKDDIKGIYAINKIQQMKYQIGKDIGVIGIGGIEAGTFCLPQLTTMKFSVQEMFEKAIVLLTEQISSENFSYSSIKIHTELIDRGSL